MALWILSRTTRVSQYQKKHSTTHICHGQKSSIICFLHLLWSMASSLINLHAWQSFSTISLQVFFALTLDLAPSTSYSIHFFTQSLSCFCSTCLYHRNLFCCSTEIMSSNPSHSLNPLLGTLSYSLMPHIHLTILISARWSATSFSFLTGQISLLCNILVCKQLLYNLPPTISGTNCLHLFHPIRILVSTAASASLSTLNMSPKSCAIAKMTTRCTLCMSALEVFRLRDSTYGYFSQIVLMHFCSDQLYECA